MVASIVVAKGTTDSDGDGVPDDADVCCQSPAHVTVDTEGRPVGDHDLDCDVDLDDYPFDIDLDDFAKFQVNFTGPLEGDSSCPLDPFAAELLFKHNEARAAISDGTFPGQPEAEPDLPALVWDDALASAAQAWADTCTITLDPNRATSYEELGGVLDQGRWVGVHAFWAGGLSYPPFEFWISEASNYNYEANTCSAEEICSHYTQVVWAHTTRLGCGKSTCDSSPWRYHYYCYYYLGGNYGGQRPYETTP